MDHPKIHDRGRGPELKGRRITVYDLVPYERHGKYTDEFIRGALNLSAEELAALRAYIAENREAVMAWDAVIEARFAKGNSPEVDAALAAARERRLRYRQWLDARKELANGTWDPSPEALAARKREFDAEMIGTQS